MCDAMPIKCNYLSCYAGLGVAGMRRCFLGGDFTKENCDMYKSDDRGQLEHAERYIEDLTAERDRYRADAEYFKRLADAAGEWIEFFTLETIPGFEGAAMAHEKELYDNYQSVLQEREADKEGKK